MGGEERARKVGEVTHRSGERSRGELKITAHLDPSESKDLRERERQSGHAVPPRSPDFHFWFQTHPQLSVFGTEGKWRMFRKSRNIFGRTPFSAIIVWRETRTSSRRAQKEKGHS